MSENSGQQAPWHGPRRVLMLSLATLFFILAVIGVLVPGLPTTPFLLLTSWCLLRSSPRLHAKLRASPLFGPLLHDWEVHHGVRMSVKIAAHVLMLGVGCVSFLLLEAALLVRILIGVLLLTGVIVVLKLPTVRD